MSCILWPHRNRAFRNGLRLSSQVLHGLIYSRRFYRGKLSISFNVKSYVFKLRLNKFGVSITTNDRDARCSGLANSFENLGLEKSLTDVVLRNPKSGTLRIMGTEIDRSLGNSFPNSSFESFLWCHVHVPPRNPRLVIESFELSDGEVTRIRCLADQIDLTVKNQ